MPFSLISDTFADDPVWEVLADGKGDRLDALQAAYVRLHAKASHLLTNGYLTEQTALQYCRNRRQVLDRLCDAVLDRSPLLHRQGDECACLGDEWVEGYAYRIHKFLKRNPSRAEYKRNRAQKADLKDQRLKAIVYQRDGGCCRYCRSGPLSAKAGRSRDRRKVLTYDHVDPDRAAEPDGTGLVVACAACNEYKGHRTPYEADLTLLDEPSDADRAAWRDRGQVLFDRPTYHQPITAETATDHRSGADRNSDRNSDRFGDPNRDPNDNTTGPARPQDGTADQEHATACSPEGLGWVGEPRPAVSERPAQPARTASAPDIYTGRSRAPTSPARTPPDSAGHSARGRPT